MKRKRFIRALAVLFSLLLCGTMLSGCGTDNTERMKLGTGGEGGNYYSYGLALSEYAQAEGNIALDVLTTSGSAANLRLISQGYLDLAIVQSDTLSDALHAEGIFAGENLTGFSASKGLFAESCQIVVAADSDIYSVENLRGKRVSLGKEDSGVYQNAMDILRASGISSRGVDAYYLDFAASAEALQEGEIDAFFCTASAPTTAIVQLAEEMEVRLLPLSHSCIDGLLGESDKYRPITLEGDIYGNGEAVETVAVTAVLLFADSVPGETREAILSILDTYNEDLQDVSFGQIIPLEKEKGRWNLTLDMFQTLALAVGVLYLGVFLKKKIRILDKFCIPAPVVGGILFAIVSCVLYALGIVEFSFDESFKNICMIMFFTSVGFQANLKVLKSGGLSLIIFLVSVVLLIVLQNLTAVGLSKVLGLDALIGMCTGSIPMVGGHGTAGAFGQVLEDLGQEGATTLCTAAATFGLIAGSLMGGPIGRRLILKHNLLNTVVPEDDSILKEDEKKHHRSVSMYAPAAYQIAIAMGIGTIVSTLLSKTGMTFPVYIGAMIVAALLRNLGEFKGRFRIHMGEINDIGGICLSLFLGIAMVTLKLWQLASLALPLVLLLIAQTLLMFLFSYFVVYNVMGRNYDAAVLAAGTTGFGMGATPNAMANMQALTDKYAPSVKAYILVPIVGSMFADFINSIVITFFINFI